MKHLKAYGIDKDGIDTKVHDHARMTHNYSDGVGGASPDEWGEKGRDEAPHLKNHTYGHERDGALRARDYANVKGEYNSHRNLQADN